jgi:hypothetical protein
VSVRLASAVAILSVGLASAAVAQAGHATIGSLAAVPTIGCDRVAMGVATNGRDPETRRVLGVVYAPRRFLQNVGSNAAAAPFHFWTKAGIYVHANVAVTVTVAKRWQSRVRITWGGEEGTELRFAACAVGGKWNPYAGGFLSRTGAVCVPLIFTAGHRRATLLFGVGRHC